MKIMLLKIFLVSLFCYLCVALLLYVFQRNFVYFPSAKYEHPYESLSIFNEGETLEIIVLNEGKSKALMYFGGNAEAVGASAEEFSTNFPDVTTYLVNYRGYGGSSGKPTESGIYADSLAVYDHVKENHDHISVAGRSLGSGVAIYLAGHRPLESVVLITPYDSVLNLAKSKYAMFPVKFLLKDHYDSLSRAKNVQSKVLVIAVEHDEVVPMSNTQRLIDELGADQVSVKIIKGRGHNNLSESTDYYELIKGYL